MKKLLIVDDNLDFLGFLVSILKQHFEVYEASGVKEALQVLENTVFGIIMFIQVTLLL